MNVSFFSSLGGGLEVEPHPLLPGGMAEHRKPPGSRRSHLHHLSLWSQRQRWRGGGIPPARSRRSRRRARQNKLQLERAQIGGKKNTRCIVDYKGMGNSQKSMFSQCVTLITQLKMSAMFS